MFAALALAAALAQPDCEALKASARPTIEHANGDWVRAMRAGDSDAIAAAYADDGLFVTPDGAVVAGRAAVRDLYAAGAKDASGIAGGGIESEGLACGAAGLLYEWGRGWLKLRRPDGRDAQRGGAYLTVWKRVGGEWKIVRNLAF
jgi:ketosteroid isomerase-like protein